MGDSDITYQFQPDLLALLIDAIPALCRSKRDVLQFFRSAGVGECYTQDLAMQLASNPESVKKHLITRTVLARLNEKGEAALRERREVLRRVVEFEDFTSEDRLKAPGFVAQVQKLVNLKDSATKIQQEVEENRQKRRAEAEREARALQERQAPLDSIKGDFFRLFSDGNPWRRGKALEGVLNRFFSAHEILVREAFVLKGSEGEGIVEQIDGVIELDGDLFLVETKWWDKPLGRGDVSEHMIRVFNRRHVRGLFIAHPGFTDPAVLQCKEFVRSHPEAGSLPNFRLHPSVSGVAQALTGAFHGALGHAAVSTCPDAPYLRWSYRYAEEQRWGPGTEVTRNNIEKYIRACERLHEHLARANGATPVPISEVRDVLERVLRTEGDSAARAAAWQQAAASGKFASITEGIPAYEGDTWKPSMRGWASAKDPGQVASDPAYRFLQAATLHRDYVLRDLLPSNGLCLT